MVTPQTRHIGWRLVAHALVALVAQGPFPGRVLAQQEFVRQQLIVNVFEGRDHRLGRSVSGALRDRIGGHHSRRELRVISQGDILDLIDGSGVTLDSALPPMTLRTIAKSLRADEMVTGVVSRSGSTIVADARLILVRDERLTQPLPRATGPSVDAVANALGESVRRARLQLVPQRRCENAIRDGKLDAALAHAREGIAAWGPGILARSCLLTALALSGRPADELLREAEAALSHAPSSWHALDAAARASDALGTKERAADYWLRLAETDTASIELQSSVIGALLRGGNAARARPLAERISDATPDDMALLRLRWQVLFAMREWSAASAAGLRLYQRDGASIEDSTFVLRLVTAVRSSGDTVRAVGLAAEATQRFPGDPRLYATYAQLVQGEAPIAIARGVERHPRSAELLLLRAQELRRAGKGSEAIEPLRRALAIDPSIGQGYLQLAQSHADAGFPDSAFIDVTMALAAGEDSATVAQFALARGNAIYRAANTSKQRADFQLAMRFLALSDSVRASAQARFLLGASALAVAQSAATDAPKESQCELSRLASSLLPLSREKLTTGAQVAPDAARQYLGYLDQLEPVVARQLETLCSGS